MKLHYYKDTDSLYTDLSAATSTESKVIDEGLVLGYDDAGLVVGIDIQHASKRVDLTSIGTEHLPLTARIA